jgi:hypothetical protein
MDACTIPILQTVINYSGAISLGICSTGGLLATYSVISTRRNSSLGDKTHLVVSNPMIGPKLQLLFRLNFGLSQ